MSTLHMIYLYGCPYSEAALNRLEMNNIKFTIDKASSDKIDYYKEKYNFNTFPHIILIKKDKVLCNVGGNDRLTEFMNEFHSKPLNDSSVTEYMKKYDTTKHNILRLIAIINNISKK